MSKELKVHYYLRHKEMKSDGTAPIMGRITIGKSWYSSVPSVVCRYPFGILSLHGQQAKARQLPD